MRRCCKPINSASVVLCLLWSTARCEDADKALQVGDLAPQFICLDDQGQLWNSREHIGQRLLVVYFFPSDFAFCCTRQAQKYRDRMHELCDCGVDVIGISGDQVETHRLFQETHKLNFALLSDASGEVARAFGVPLRTGGKAMIAKARDQQAANAAGQALNMPRKFTAARWTFIVGRDGRILYRETNVSPVKDSQDVLEFLRTLDAR